jgi:hypothetical protein
MPSNCRSQIVAKAPTESCVSTVITTSGQCGCSGLTWVMSRGRAFGGNAGSVTRVVDRLWSPPGTPGCGRRAGCVTAAIDARQSATLTISIWIAPSGQALTHAGDCPVSSRPWHMSHLPTTPRCGLYCGTP